VLEGEMDGHRLAIRMRRRDPSKAMPHTLRNPGFRWICEFPFNR